MDPVGTIFETKESSMKWFKRMVARWVREADELPISEANALKKLRRGNSIGTQSESIDGHAGLNITVMSAVGGKIVTFRHYDRRNDENKYRHYVIPDDLDFERELGKMITMESLRQA
jgi:hypothetical protein